MPAKDSDSEVWIVSGVQEIALAESDVDEELLEGASG